MPTTSEMNPVYDPMQRRMVSGPEAGQNTTVDGFQVNVIGGGTGSEGLYNAGDGLDLTGSTFSVNLTAGFRTEISGSTIMQARYVGVETVSGSSVTLQAGHAYKIYATSASVALNTETIQPETYGLEAHLEILVASTGYVVAGSNVVLTSALEPDAVNNCTVRFHDGLAIISVVDHIAGYIVVSASGTTSGSLPYGITSATQEYVAFDATTNGAVIDLSGSTASGEKHIVGNGYNSTTLTGAVDCGASKFTIANLALQNVVVNGGTMTLGDTYIPSGSTVSVSGGGLAVEKVTGDGGTIDLGGTNVSINSGSTASASGCTFSGGSAGRGGAFICMEKLTLENCAVVSCYSNSGQGNVATQGSSALVILSNCSITDNPPNDLLLVGGTISLTGGTYGKCRGGKWLTSRGMLTIAGNTAIEDVKQRGDGDDMSVIISSGAVLDLRNAVSNAIVPGGDVIVDGGCQVITSAGTTVSIAGGTYTKINNDGTTE